MKLMTLLCTLLITGATQAQTEDGYLRIQFLGQSGGKYMVQITNKQHCKADFSFQFTGTATGVSPNPKNNLTTNEIGPLATAVYQITGTLTGIKIKALSVCNWAGSAPIWLILDNKALPVHFKAIRIKKIAS